MRKFQFIISLSLLMGFASAAFAHANDGQKPDVDAMGWDHSTDYLAQIIPNQENASYLADFKDLMQTRMDAQREVDNNIYYYHQFGPKCGTWIDSFDVPLQISYKRAFTAYEAEWTKAVEVYAPTSMPSKELRKLSSFFHQTLPYLNTSVEKIKHVPSYCKSDDVLNRAKADAAGAATCMNYCISSHLNNVQCSILCQ